MRDKIRLVSSADTGHFYTTTKNKKTMPDKMEIKKFDPVVRKHVIYKEAKMAALDLLSRREHSALEIQRKLTKRQRFSEVDMDKLCAELVAGGWLSHQRFTESFIRARRSKGQGPVKIGQSCSTLDWQQFRQYDVFAVNSPKI